MSSQEQIREANRLTLLVKQIYAETGRPYGQIEDEIFADFWAANPDWSPGAVSARKINNMRVNSDNEMEDQ